MNFLETGHNLIPLDFAITADALWTDKNLPNLLKQSFDSRIVRKVVYMEFLECTTSFQATKINRPLKLYCMMLIFILLKLVRE